MGIMQMNPALLLRAIEKCSAKWISQKRLSGKAEKLWDKHKDKEGEKWTDQALYGKGGYIPEDVEPTDYNLYGKGGYELKKKKKSPFGYSAPVDVFAIIEKEDSSPLGYVMDGAKVKDTSPNQAFSSKDFDIIQQLQNNYKESSEGSFKTNSQNIYSSFDNPLTFRGFNPGLKKDSGPTEAETALAAADRRTQQNTQGLQNAATGLKMGLDVAGKVIQAVGMFSDRRLKKDIKLLGLSPAGLKIYSFKYKDNKYGKDIYQGVMSDEIPAYAVIKNTDGYDMVDYNKLDVEFKAI